MFRVVKVWRKYDPDPIVDVNSPEAVAEFKRLRDAGVFGCRNQAEYLERQRIADLYDKYEKEMTFAEFLDRLEAGTLPERGK